jgi:S-DNA-T family DNA segregation ATPase FtsK/SpoIIIE
VAKQSRRPAQQRRRGNTARSTPRKSPSKSRTKPDQAESSRKPRGRTVAAGDFLTPDRKLDLLGGILVVAGVLTFVGMFYADEGALAIAWLKILRGGFGWGMVVLPLTAVAVGAWLILRRFEERLPRVEPERLVGLALLYLALLVVFHAWVGPATWEEAVAVAFAGRGGGLVGAGMYRLLMNALGGGGTFVALLAWILAGLVFVAGLSLPELVAVGGQVVTAIRVRLFTARGASLTKRRPISAAADRRGAPASGPGVSGEALARTPDMPILAEPASGTGGLATTQPRPAWILPVVEEILEPGAVGKADDDFDQQRARLIEDTLLAFGTPAKVVEINRGPTITQFGVEPDFIEGRGGKRIKVKVSKISALADDLALALAAPSIRVEAPVPGKGYVGIEVPNPEISLVALRDVMQADASRRIRSPLRLALGQDVSGRAVAADLTAMPHLLIAGTTGSGKSVCVNAIISCLLLQNSPDDLKLVMVDPKRVELTYYNGIPHLLAPVVVELERVVPALQWVSREMDERYRRFAKEGARNIADFNQRAAQVGQKPLPYLVVVIDELADLMMLAPDETERVITRLAQLARATGIHLVIATQRPSVDVVTGLIKANFPARIAFAVASSVDSRVILDQPGAERLLGRGDMLFQAPDAPAPVRMQGAFVSERELNGLILYWKGAALGEQPVEAQRVPEALPLPTGAAFKQAPLWEEGREGDIEPSDELFYDAVELVRGMRRASISLLQRRMRIGYTRAARLVDELEERGIIGPAQQGSQAREVLDYGDLTPPGED